MTLRGSIFSVILLSCILAGCAGGDFIAGNGKTDYRIVLSDTASESTINGAHELQRFLFEMTGAEFPIVSDTLPEEEHEIVLGKSSRLDDLDIDIDFDALGDEGYILRTVGKRLIIAGGDLRGTMYGVYGLLEDHLGCRWFTPEVSRIPKYRSLPLPVLDETVIPVLEYREPYIWDAKDGDWAARNRMNRNTFAGGLEKRHGGDVQWVPGFFVHTFERLVPKEKYYDSHPEYFSLVNGERMRGLSQLCCTNDDVLDIVVEGVRKALRENPQAKILSVDQNDCYNFCECPKCQALAKEEGSQMAPVLQLVNAVADSIRDEFPDRAIVTLAYQWTRHAPKEMRPRDNVIIRLCSIECCFTHPFDTCDGEANVLFTKDLRDWSRISNRLWVWNYTTDFSHYLLPFPNLYTRNDNLKLFVGNNVTGMFQQDTPNIPHGEFSELGAYLHAKLLWNPDYDENTAIDEFLEAYYGPAGRYMRSYLDYIHEKAERENIHMGCYESPETRLLDGDYFAVADSLFNLAEKACAKDETCLNRVRASRLSPEYAYVARDINDKAYVVDQENVAVRVNDDYMRKVDEFIDDARGFGVEYLNEKGLTLAQFKDGITSRLGTHKLSWKAPVTTAGLARGISWMRYNSGWESEPLFEKTKPVKTGVSDAITLPEHGMTELFGMAYEGFIDIPEDGIWAFYTYSDDGSMLYVDGDLVVDNGGRHAMEERVGFAALRKGKHALRVTWFNGAGGLGLEVYLKGPGIKKNDIPSAMLYHSE